MINLDQTVFIRADRMGEVFIEGLEEMMGHASLVTVLKQAGVSRRKKKPLEIGDLERILEAMGVLFGPQAGFGMAQCAGRACFKYGLRDFGAELGLHDLQFRLQPPAVKIREGMELLAQLAGQFHGVIVRVEQDQSYYQWIVHSTEARPDRQLNPPVYHLMVGILRELLYWASGGKSYAIDQKDGDGIGNPVCTIVIARQPLE
jgi:hypothetical protein